MAEVMTRPEYAQEGEMAELEACPNQECKHPKPEVWNSADEACHVICFECGVAGPYEKTPEDATAAWNALPRTDYREVAQQLATALELARVFVIAVTPNGGLANVVLEEMGIPPALAAAKEAGIVPEVKA